MDPDTYNQLMQCLKQIKVTKPSKVDKGTPTKKVKKKSLYTHTFADRSICIGSAESMITYLKIGSNDMVIFLRGVSWLSMPLNFSKSVEASRDPDGLCVTLCIIL